MGLRTDSALAWRSRRGWAAVVLAAAALVSSGCRQDMHDQHRLEPLEASSFWANGAASRLPVPGTVARGQLNEDAGYLSGLDGAGGWLEALPTDPETGAPMVLDAALLDRGRERFDIFCSPCHSRIGDGSGMIVRRGFKRPESFHTDRLRAVSVGYVVDVVTRGFGQMPKYSAQIPPRDRWAIAAYVKALQLSQYAPSSELPADVLSAVEEGGQDAAPPGAADSEHSEGS